VGGSHNGRLCKSSTSISNLANQEQPRCCCLDLQVVVIGSHLLSYSCYCDKGVGIHYIQFGGYFCDDIGVVI